MANYTTNDDLIADALWRAGEPSTGSDYATTVITYLNAAQLGLLTGGPIGPGDEKGMILPIVDWWWARKSPRGILNTEAEITTGTITVTLGSTTATFSSAPAASVAGWHLRVGSQAPVVRITTHTGGSTSATLDAAWPDPTQTTSTYHLFKIDYALASDFLRFCGNPTLTEWPYKLGIVDQDVFEDTYPLSRISAGTPSIAALLAPATIRLNHWTESVKRIEYPYIYAPTDLTSGSGEAAVPRHHRRLLSTIAAGWIAMDKADDKAATLFTESQRLLRAMIQEHNHHMRRANASFGRIEARQDLKYQYPIEPLRTESGLIIGG